MAKELPYYKFEPNEWDNGNIQICTHEQKGVFIDLCSMYWARLGDVPYKLAIQKICGGNANALDSLIENQIFEVIDGNIYIKFLSEQLNEFENTSERNSKIAREGWEKRRKQKEIIKGNANAKRTQSDGNAIREDKSKEDKSKENIIENKKQIFIASLKPHIEEYGKDLLNDFFHYWSEPNLARSKLRFEMQKTWDLNLRLKTWKKNETKFNKNNNGKSTNTREQNRNELNELGKNALRELLD